MTETEQRCAQIEKEALATWACEKFSTYILGMIETDHKPLVPLLGTKQLDNFPPRVLWFRLCLARFDYNINHVPGNFSTLLIHFHMYPHYQTTMTQDSRMKQR